MHSITDGSTDTAYEFEYWTLSDNWEWYEFYIPLYYKYLDLEGTQEQRNLGIVSIIAASLLLIIIITACFMCCKKYSGRQ